MSQGAPGGGRAARNGAARPADEKGGVPVRTLFLGVFVLGLLSALSFPSVGAVESASDAPLAPTRSPVTVPLPRTEPFRVGVLTADGSDRYALTETADTSIVTVRAPRSNRSGNLRTVFWSDAAPATTDATSCATWRAASDVVVQPGAALRIASRASGGVAALTVTKNVFVGVDWVFNVHVWDSARGTSRLVGSFELRALKDRPAPWRLCARTRAGRLEFKVWVAAAPEPAWGDPDHGASMAVPADVPARGRAGWYVGHLRAGMAASFTELGDASGRGGPLAGATGSTSSPR